jgi:hypothetical protein
LEAEIAARRQRVIETSLHISGLPWQKRLSDFDFSFQPKSGNKKCGRRVLPVG